MYDMKRKYDVGVSVRIDNDNNKKIRSVCMLTGATYSVFKHSVGRQDGREGLINFSHPSNQSSL